MTFALAARCEKTTMFGVVVASSSPAVAARCPYAEAGVGAFSSQNITDPTLGRRGLELMRGGVDASETVNILKRTSPHMAYRQIFAVDINGETAVFSGTHTLGIYAEEQTKNVAAAGNLLANKNVIEAMMNEFLRTEGHLGDRLIMALMAALSAGGEAGPVHSAGMKIADKTSWPLADLRCDWSDECPIAKLQQIWQIYKPQMNDYILRAQDPVAAPAYCVPGETEK